MFRFGARAMTGLRLRWLSERGVAIAGGGVLRWMLKRVPRWGGEWGRWLDSLRIPAAQPATAVFCQSRLLWEAALAPMASARSRPEPAPTRNNRPLGQRPPPDKNTHRNQARISLTARY